MTGDKNKFVDLKKMMDQSPLATIILQRFWEEEQSVLEAKMQWKKMLLYLKT